MKTKDMSMEEALLQFNKLARKIGFNKEFIINHHNMGDAAKTFLETYPVTFRNEFPELYGRTKCFIDLGPIDEDEDEV